MPKQKIKNPNEMVTVTVTRQQAYDLLYAAKAGSNRLHKCYHAEVSKEGGRHLTDALCAAEAVIRDVYRQAGIPQAMQMKSRKKADSNERNQLYLEETNANMNESDFEIKNKDPMPLIFGSGHTNDWKDTEEFVDGIYKEREESR